MKKICKGLGVILFVFLVSLTLRPEPVQAKVMKNSLSKAVVKLGKKKFAYTGKEKKPKVVVRLGGKKLKMNKDYRVLYKNNKKPGKATVTILPKNKKKYKGQKKLSFTITKAERKLVPAKSEYSAVEGDGAFTITAVPSKGKGTVVYSCSTHDVINVTKAGRVTVINNGTATVTMRVAATAYYKAAEASVKVKISPKPIRKVDSDASVKNYVYPILNYACDSFKLTDFSWSVENKYVIPGLGPTAEDDLIQKYIQCNNLCPQGICVAGDYLMTTAYCVDDVHESCVFVYDRESGEYLNTLILTEKSHVGGITYDGGDGTQGNVWICHSESNCLQRIPYAALKTYVTGSKTCVRYKPDELVMSDNDGFHGVANKPSAIAYNPIDGYLWVTEFVNPGASREATMAAYQYRDGKLEEVSKYLHSAEEDYLGVITSTPGGEEKEEAAVTGGAVVVSVVTEKEGLEDAFLEEGDIITAIDGKTVEDKESLDELLKVHTAGETISVEAKRAMEDGESRTLSGSFKLEERSRKPAARTIPYSVQGITFSENGKAIFSRSWGRNPTKDLFVSELMVFDATWNSDEMWDSEEIWREEKAVALPPMAEEVEMNGDEVYILFESAALSYLEGTDGKGKSECPIDKIISVDLDL